MKNKCILFCLILLSISGIAQTFSIDGKILSSNKKTPVMGAQVFLTPGNYSTESNESGVFNFKSLKNGSYVISIHNTGFTSLSQTIKIENANQTLDFILESTVVKLDEVNINVKQQNDFGINRLNSVEGTSIYSGKKTDVIKMDNVTGNLAANSSRQIYSKVPGLNIWESDGAGLQLGIGGRGLSPNRVSNFNTRQNGYDISADALGYPESYYTPPAEAIEQIEIVRGAASLQYGTQFGGMVNFKLKKGPEDKKLQFISRQTGGSFGFYNTFNSLGGTVKKWNYYVCHQYKRGDGWRENSGFSSNLVHSAFTYKANDKLSLSLEYTYMHYLAQQAGGLTDFLFDQNPRQSIRNRNWFKVNWNLGAVILNYKINAKSEFNWRNFGLYAGRDALGFLGSINRADPLEERNYLQDVFKNFGSEARFIHKYKAFKKDAVFLVGARYYKGFTDRKQGLGNSSNGPDFTFLNPNNLEDSDFDFPSQNIAAFTENIFYLNQKLSITPGIRFENIYTSSIGYYNEEYKDLAGNIIFQQKTEDNRSNSRSFVIGGLGMSYKASKKMEFYGNISQNYRAINFNDMRVANVNLVVDPNLKDEKGYSSDLGIRGTIKSYFSYDVSLFLLNYQDRIGSVLLTDSATYNLYRYRTNIADSKSYGVESFFELDVWKLIKGASSKNSLSIFTNIGLLDARYNNSKEAAYENKKVELAPAFIGKTGLTFSRENIKVNCQFSYTDQQYTDATNAEFASNAVSGIVPAYYILDLSLQYTLKKFLFAGGVNNLTNNLYFTRRADGYPGPGIIPSDGRSLYLTVQVKL